MSERLVVSLTSFPARIGCVAAALETIYAQTRQADEVVLWLADEQFPGGEESLPGELQGLIAEGRLTLRWCPDLKPHKKYLYAFREYPDDLIVTVDDDLLYDPRLLEDLYACFLRHPKAVSAARVHLMSIDEAGSVLPYESWIFETDALVDEPSMQLFATGGAGALYPPHLLDRRMLDEEAIRETCLYADDIWLKAMEAVSGVSVVLARPYRDLQYVPGSQNVALWRGNLSGSAVTGGNDRQLEQVSSWLDEIYGLDALSRALRAEGCGQNQLGIAAYARHAAVKYRRTCRQYEGIIYDRPAPKLVDTVTARLDVKNVGANTNDLVVLELSDAAAVVKKPSWFQRDGTGYVFTSAEGALDLRLRCVGAGTLQLALRGVSVMDQEGRRKPILIDYTSCRLSGVELLDTPRVVWHDHPFKYERKVKDGEIVELSFAWCSHAQGEFERTQQQLEQMQRSTTWRTGSALLWLPRKVRQLVSGLIHRLSARRGNVG